MLLVKNREQKQQSKPFNHKKLGVDIDGVLANFGEAFLRHAARLNLNQGMPNRWEDISCWVIGGNNFHPAWDLLKHDENFWLDILPLEHSQIGSDITVDCFITARTVRSQISKQWLMQHRRTLKINTKVPPVFTVSHFTEKLKVIRERGLDVFVDDHIDTIIFLRQNGVEAYLYKNPHQRSHDCGELPSIENFTELKPFLRHD